MTSQFIKLLDYFKLRITTTALKQIQAEVVTYCQPRVDQTGDIWLIELTLKDF